MLNKFLSKFSKVIGCFLVAIAMVSVGTISLFGPYEHPIPDHLIPKVDQ